MKSIKHIAALCAITFPLLGADTPQTTPPAAPANNGRKVEKPAVTVPFKADPMRGDWQGDGGVSPKFSRRRMAIIMQTC